MANKNQIIDDLAWLRKLCLPDGRVVTHTEVCERVDRIVAFIEGPTVSIFSRPECPFSYCDQREPYAACQTKCRYASDPIPCRHCGTETEPGCEICTDCALLGRDES